jgi:hypothetical protein
VKTEPERVVYVQAVGVKLRVYSLWGRAFVEEGTDGGD